MAADTRDRPLPRPTPSGWSTRCCRSSSHRKKPWPRGRSSCTPTCPTSALTQRTVKGEAAAALADSAAVVEAVYHTQINHQAPLEPEAAVAYREGEGDDAQLVVVGRSINIHKASGDAAGRARLGDMRYEEAFSGGQFGIKIEITCEGIAGAAAIHFSRPVRYIPGLTDTCC